MEDQAQIASQLQDTTERLKVLERTLRETEIKYADMEREYLGRMHQMVISYEHEKAHLMAQLREANTRIESIAAIAQVAKPKT